MSSSSWQRNSVAANDEHLNAVEKFVRPSASGPVFLRCLPFSPNQNERNAYQRQHTGAEPYHGAVVGTSIRRGLDQPKSKHEHGKNLSTVIATTANPEASK